MSSSFDESDTLSDLDTLTSPIPEPGATGAFTWMYPDQDAMLSMNQSEAVGFRVAGLPEVIGVRCAPQAKIRSGSGLEVGSRTVAFRPFASLESAELAVTEIRRALFCSKRKVGSSSQSKD
jgi:hypothetical protein